MKTLKITFLICFFLTSFLEANSQSKEYFYYYKDKKQTLQLNTEYFYVVTSPEISSADELSSVLGDNVAIFKFSRENTAQTLRAVSKPNTEPEYLAQAQLKVKLSGSDYLNYIANLKNKRGVKLIAPYFKSREENKIGLSHYFHVKLKNQQDYTTLEKKALETNTQIVGQNKFMSLWYTLKCTATSRGNALQNANIFYESKLFEFAEPDLLLEDLINSANDPQFANQWGLNNTGLYGGTAGIDINAVNAWEITKGSREVVVAVLDDGFERDHPDLQGNTFGPGFNTETGTSPSLVLGKHGTACAGIIAAVQDNNRGVSGIAPNVHLLPISVSFPASYHRLADGINWAWQNGAAIISNSWGGGGGSSLTDDAITNALTNGRGGLGTIVVFAAGNNNSSVSYPANSNADIIAVGAMSQCAERKRSSSDPALVNPGVSPDPAGVSCDGQVKWGSNFGSELDVVAPGVLISTTDRQGSNGYTSTDYTSGFGGTSSACPAVAGVAALILSVNPCLTHDQVEDIIEKTAQKVGTYSYGRTAGRSNGTWHNEMGYGLVDAEASARMAQSMLPIASGFDLYSKDQPYDTGVEPNPDSGPMWISEDIWVRQNPDGGTDHENPEYKVYSPNAVYVKVTNRGTQTSTCTNLSVYFTKASTGLVWPTHWSNYFQTTSAGSVLHGDKINTVLIPALAPGASYTAEIPWFPPNPADFDSDVHHFCLLARLTSPADPMFDEQNEITVMDNAKKNNNIAWKNISIYNLDSDVSFVAMNIFVRGVQEGWNKINLRFFDQGFKKQFKTRFFERGGAIRLTVDPKFRDRLRGVKLQDVKFLDNNTLLVTSPKAQIRNIPVYSKETFSMALNFKVDLQEKEETILDVVQENSETGKLEGGERFIIKKTQKGDFYDILNLVEKSNLIVYPNPVKEEITIKYKILSSNNTVEIYLQNVIDRKQRVKLFSGNRDQGDYQDKFNIQNLKKGVYILTLKTDDQTIAEKIIKE